MIQIATPVYKQIQEQSFKFLKILKRNMFSHIKANLGKNTQMQFGKPSYEQIDKNNYKDIFQIIHEQTHEQRKKIHKVNKTGLCNIVNLQRQFTNKSTGKFPI